jgi:calcineurin-like phosphoesterase family protein
MSTIWFTADSHFGHEAIIRHCDRPFTSVEEMDEALIDKWNAVVGKNDIVYHLGDVGFSNDTHTLECVSRLRGHKRLISGNHDPVHPRHRKSAGRQRTWMQFFESVSPFEQVKIGSHEVMLSHFPYVGDHTEGDRFAQFRLRDEGLFLLHGHVHTAWLMQGRQLNVGVDVNDFEPVPLDAVTEIVRHHFEAWQAIEETEHDKVIRGRDRAPDLVPVTVEGR